MWIFIAGSVWTPATSLWSQTEEFTGKQTELQSWTETRRRRRKRSSGHQVIIRSLSVDLYHIKNFSFNFNRVLLHIMRKSWIRSSSGYFTQSSHLNFYQQPWSPWHGSTCWGKHALRQPAAPVVSCHLFMWSASSSVRRWSCGLGHEIFSQTVNIPWREPEEEEENTGMKRVNGSCFSRKYKRKHSKQIPFTIKPTCKQKKTDWRKSPTEQQAPTTCLYVRFTPDRWWPHRASGSMRTNMSATVGLKLLMGSQIRRKSEEFMFIFYTTISLLKEKCM